MREKFFSEWAGNWGAAREACSPLTLAPNESAELSDRLASVERTAGRVETDFGKSCGTDCTEGDSVRSTEAHRRTFVHRFVQVQNNTESKGQTTRWKTLTFGE